MNKHNNLINKREKEFLMFSRKSVYSNLYYIVQEIVRVDILILQNSIILFLILYS